MSELCPETPGDTPEIEALLDLCFAPGRTALSSYRLREGVAPVAACQMTLVTPLTDDPDMRQTLQAAVETFFV